MAVCLGIDVGTSGTKALAVAPDGRILAAANAGYPCHFPKPLWSEQDPEEAGEAEAGGRDGHRPFWADAWLGVSRQEQ
jgi:sugar (pentulose or hexulose) kinase